MRASSTEAHNAASEAAHERGGRELREGALRAAGPRSQSRGHDRGGASGSGSPPASASGMLHRLADDGVVEYAPYHGARLTPEGERIALEVIRHHRLIELFLAEVLGMPWDRVHAEAEVLEHHISEELEELIAAKLGEPAARSAWRPDPDRDLAISSDGLGPAHRAAAGDEGAFARVSDSDASMLRYLAERDPARGRGWSVEGRRAVRRSIDGRDRRPQASPRPRAGREHEGRRAGGRGRPN